MNINKVRLKVKAKSLAEEARIIRKLEHSIKDKANVARSNVQNKKDESFILNCDYIRSDIRHHRKCDVSRESRATNIAMGFLSGMPYERIENKLNVETAWFPVPANEPKTLYDYNENGKHYNSYTLWKRVISICWKYSTYSRKQELGFVPTKMHKEQELEFAEFLLAWRNKHPDINRLLTKFKKAS